MEEHEALVKFFGLHMGRAMGFTCHSEPVTASTRLSLLSAQVGTESKEFPAWTLFGLCDEAIVQATSTPQLPTPHHMKIPENARGLRVQAEFGGRVRPRLMVPYALPGMLIGRA